MEGSANGVGTRFSSACLTESCLFGYGSKDFFLLHKLNFKVELTVKTDDVTGGTRDEQWIRTGGSGVNRLN